MKDKRLLCSISAKINKALSFNLIVNNVWEKKKKERAQVTCDRLSRRFSSDKQTKKMSRNLTFTVSKHFGWKPTLEQTLTSRYHQTCQAFA